MALSKQQQPGGEVTTSQDAESRPLSVTAVENEFVEGVYGRLANVYDFVYGAVLHPGRLRALEHMALQPGQSILEVGVGTGINATLYPRGCPVVGIDLSAPMLDKARQRCARHGARNVRLLLMDAAKMTFPDHSFDVVYAPYLISVVPDPVRVAREMRRVCRRGGRIVILNHFRSPNRVLSWLEQAISPLTRHVGFMADLDLPAFLAQAGLKPTAVAKVNIPRIWSLVTCVNE